MWACMEISAISLTCLLFLLQCFPPPLERYFRAGLPLRQVKHIQQDRPLQSCGKNIDLQSFLCTGWYFYSSSSLLSPNTVYCACGITPWTRLPGEMDQTAVSLSWICVCGEKTIHRAMSLHYRSHRSLDEIRSAVHNAHGHGAHGADANPGQQHHCWPRLFPCSAHRLTEVQVRICCQARFLIESFVYDPRKAFSLPCLLKGGKLSAQKSVLRIAIIRTEGLKYINGENCTLT